MKKTLFSGPCAEANWEFNISSSITKRVSCVFDPDDLHGDGLLVLWGGEDIHPSLYGEKPHPSTWVEKTPSTRDGIEMSLISRAIELGIPILGLCRGAQMLCIANGGKLIQDTTGHNKEHRIKTCDDTIFNVNSIHHQMMYPWGISNVKLLARSQQGLSSKYEGEDLNRQVSFPVEAIDDFGEIIEPEIVFFKDINALAVQGHPEYMNAPHGFLSLTKEYMRKYLK